MTRKNTHMTHIDEALFEGGQSTTYNLKRILESGSYKLSVKWDGAPSIFVGRDPLDGQFFIGTKSVFNKNPKLYKNVSEIMAAEPFSKAKKLAEAFMHLYFSKLNIPANTVLQGDLIFTNDSLRIDSGYVTAHANTLVYAWDIFDNETLELFDCDIGVVFHTTYTGEGELQNYTANFGCDISNLNVPENVWIRSADIDASFKVDEVPVMSDKADVIVDIMSMLPDSRIGAHIKSFYNNRIRESVTYLPNLSDYIRFVNNYYDKQVFDKLKSDAGKEKAQLELDNFLTAILNNADAFYEAFEYVAKMEKVKQDILDQLNQASDQTVFVYIDGKLQRTSHEGYVLIDTMTGDAFKIVDRHNFSFFNFSDNVLKGWES